MSLAFSETFITYHSYAERESSCACLYNRDLSYENVQAYVYDRALEFPYHFSVIPNVTDSVQNKIVAFITVEIKIKF